MVQLNKCLSSSSMLHTNETLAPGPESPLNILASFVALLLFILTAWLLLNFISFKWKDLAAPDTHSCCVWCGKVRLRFKDVMIPAATSSETNMKVTLLEHASLQG